MWRNETMGSYFLVFNAILNYDHLSAGRVAGGQGTSSTVAAGGEEEEQD
jgi:hypothetical protein